MFVSPALQLTHSPQKLIGCTTTPSPVRNFSTPAPSAATSPENSWPMVIGGMRRPVLPSQPCTSLPQMPQPRTLTSTSPAPGTGASTSRSSKCFGPRNFKLFIMTALLDDPRPRTPHGGKSVVCCTTGKPVRPF